jgi:hypothetical protein
MTVNQRRKRKRGETRSHHQMVTIDLSNRYRVYTKPMIFVINGRDETREIKCRVWE